MVYNVKNEKFHCSTWIMVRKVKNLENETQTLYDLECGEKTEKRANWDTNNVSPVIWYETLKNMQIEKYTMEDLEYSEKTEKRGKWDTNTF